MRFLSDENFNNHLLNALKKTFSDLDILRVQDTEIYQADDPKVLEWAATEQRILLTHDLKTIPKYAYERLEKGLPLAGVIAMRQDLPLKDAIEDLELLIGAGEKEDFENQVRYIPLS